MVVVIADVEERNVVVGRKWRNPSYDDFPGEGGGPLWKIRPRRHSACVSVSVSSSNLRSLLKTYVRPSLNLPLCNRRLACDLKITTTQRRQLSLMAPVVVIYGTVAGRSLKGDLKDEGCSLGRVSTR